MHHTRFVLALAVLLPALGESVLAGGLSPELQQLIQSKPANEQVSVWIQPAQSSRGRQLAAAAESQSATRVDRYHLVESELHSRAQSNQSGIVSRLQALEKSQRAGGVKGHWVSNIVEATVAVGELQGLAQRPDIGMIYPVPRIELIRPMANAGVTSPSSPDTVFTNIKYIKANSAWAAGYTGAGRVVCIIDVGIDGSHRAIKSRWKGLNGDSAAAWFDPLTHTKYPQVVPVNFLSIPQHGTHVAGIVVGRDSVTNDTIGVAPNAKWIAAAVVDRAGASILDAFDWAADPDGDPNSVDDVPDVINHSWGYDSLACVDLFFDAIDNTEALGIVNIFSAGNEGNGVATIRIPAARDNDSLDCFAVGATDITTVPVSIWLKSSRGPSQCNGHVKPNVVAPGFHIKSCWPGNSYQVLDGTSMAAPHVSGLVALLRQKNPNATVDEIKRAILVSTKRTNAGIVPNNSWGWGEIDCLAALNALPANATPVKLRVWDFPHPLVNPGGTFNAPVIVQNRGLVTATGVTGTITGTDSRLTILNGAVTFGSVNASDTTRSSSNIRVTVAANVTAGTLIPLNFLLTANGGISVPTKLYFQVGTPPQQNIASHINSKLKFTVTNYGLFGGGPTSMFPFGGVGFQLPPSTSNYLYEGGLMIGTGLSQVSSAVKSFIDKPDQDFAVVPGGDLVYTAPGAQAAQQTHSVFNDATAISPVGVELTQDSYLQDAPDDDFVTVRYVLRNTTTHTINNLHIGVCFDWDCGGPSNYTNNSGGFEADDSLLWIAWDDGSTLSAFRGMKLVKGRLATAMTGRSDDVTLLPFLGGNGYLTYEKWQSLTNGFVTSDSLKSKLNDLFQVLAAGPIALAPGGVDTVAFAVMGADNLAAIKTIANKVKSAFHWSCCQGTVGNIDCDLDGNVDIGDLTVLVDYMFISLQLPCCPDAAQYDPAPEIDIADLTGMVQSLYIDFTPPPACP